MVNRLFTIVALSLMSPPAQAASADMGVSVSIFSPTATIRSIPPEAIRARPLKGPGLTFQGEPGQVIRYSAGTVSGTVILDGDGAGRFVLPKSVPQNTEITLHYD